MTDKELNKFTNKMMRKIIDKAATFCEEKYPWMTPDQVALTVDEVIMNLAARAVSEVILSNVKSDKDKNEIFAEYITHLSELMDIQIELESDDVDE